MSTNVSSIDLRGEQCRGGAARRRRHKKPFIGLSDLAQLTFCEIQSTISQLASQAAYIAAAFADDATDGVGVRVRAAMTDAQRADSAERLGVFGEDVAAIPLLRRVAGQLAESLELNGTQTERRHFDFGSFYVLGCPDAVDTESVKEFSRSRYPRLAIDGKVIQCNLYVALWERSRGDVTVVSYDGSDRITRTVRGNLADAERWLKRAWELLSGTSAPRPPDRTARSRSCIYNEKRGCPFPRDGSIPDIETMSKIADRFGS